MATHTLTMAVLIAMFLSVCSQTACAMGQDDFQAGLQAAADEIRTNGNIPGIVVAVETPEHGVKIVASGLADWYQVISVEPDDHFAIGSITKTFVGVVILQLAEEGRLSLDDTVVDYYSSPNLDPRITIRHLLTHSSGIYDYQDLKDELPMAMLAVMLSKDWEPEEVVEFCLERPLYFDPGEKYKYSNPNYFLLGLIIEKVTGNGVHEEIRSRILDPLGMHDTYFGGREALPESPMRCYAMDTDPPRDRTNWENPSVAWAAGALVSNASDLLKYMHGLFGGELLDEASLEEMKHGVSRGRRGEYGLGLMVVPTRAGTMYGHEGGTLGFSTGMWYAPDAGMYIVVLTNRFACDLEPVYKAIGELVLGPVAE